MRKKQLFSLLNEAWRVFSFNFVICKGSVAIPDSCEIWVSTPGLKIIACRSCNRTYQSNYNAKCLIECYSDWALSFQMDLVFFSNICFFKYLNIPYFLWAVYVIYTPWRDFNKLIYIKSVIRFDEALLIKRGGYLLLTVLDQSVNENFVVATLIFPFSTDFHETSRIVPVTVGFFLPELQP